MSISKMKPITLAQAADAMGGTLIGGDGTAVIESVIMDSRLDVTGALFVAIAGERADGHDFVPDVLSRGAVCCLVEREIPHASGPQILVDSTLRAVRDLAGFYRRMFDIPFIGITGSVGKTSTKDMLATTLSAKFRVHRTAGNFNNELGVPMTLLALRDEHEVAVIEMGISDFGEMTRLTDMVRPHIAILTIIGYAHLDNLGDRSGVYKAKTEIFHGLQESGMALLNGDDDMLRICNVADIAPGKTHTTRRLYGLEPHNNYRATNITSLGEAGTSCTFTWDDHTLDVTIPAFGTPFVYAALASTAVGDHLGMTPEEIKRGIAAFHTVQGRANVIRTETLTIIDDCYNANPSSVKASVTSLTDLPGRRAAILGDMKELGADSVALHREMGEHAANCGIDCIIAIGEMSVHTYESAKAKNPNLQVLYFSEKPAALTALPDLLRRGDQVLVKASRSGRFEEIVAALKELTL